jgi:hypothetical protein
VLKLTKKEPETVVLDVDWSGIETGSDHGRRPGRDSRGDRSRGRGSREPNHRDGETLPEVEPVAARRAPRRREESVALAASLAADSDDAQPYVDASDWASGATPPREPRTARRPARSSNAEGARFESGRRDQGREAGRSESERDTTVVGFGSETPAFLLRAAPVAPFRKVATSED